MSVAEADPQISTDYTDYFLSVRLSDKALLQVLVRNLCNR